MESVYPVRLIAISVMLVEKGHVMMEVASWDILNSIPLHVFDA